MSLPLPNRIKNKKDFDEVFKKGKAANGSFLFIKVMPTSLGRARFGFVVSAKVAPLAVLRNKVRRGLSAVIWPDLLPKMPSCDTVVVVTKKVPAETEKIKADFIQTLHKARLA
jgi:ribonuclease P protein component